MLKGGCHFIQQGSSAFCLDQRPLSLILLIVDVDNAFPKKIQVLVSGIILLHKSCFGLQILNLECLKEELDNIRIILEIGILTNNLTEFAGQHLVLDARRQQLQKLPQQPLAVKGFFLHHHGISNILLDPMRKAKIYHRSIVLRQPNLKLLFLFVQRGHDDC